MLWVAVVGTVPVVVVDPPLSWPALSVVPLSKNVTEPVGAGAVPAVLTTALSVMDAPETGGLGE